MALVNIYTILYVFCQDTKWELDQIWLNKRWAFDQDNQTIEKNYTINNQIFFQREILKEKQLAQIALKCNLFFG